jgi:hypothetical protein
VVLTVRVGSRLHYNLFVPLWPETPRVSLSWSKENRLSTRNQEIQKSRCYRINSQSTWSQQLCNSNWDTIISNHTWSDYREYNTKNCNEYCNFTQNPKHWYCIVIIWNPNEQRW